MLLIKSKPKSVEKVIRYYLLFLPPRGVNSIIDIGCGVTAPYRGLLKARCKRYLSFDINRSAKVNVVGNIINLPFKNKSFEWGWCSEVIEHLKPIYQRKAIKEIERVCSNIVITFPTPKHLSFNEDKTHNEVIYEFKSWVDKSTKTGRSIFIKEDRNENKKR